MRSLRLLVPSLFSQSATQHRLDRTSAEILRIREQVPVGVHRFGDTRMAESGLDDLQIQVRRYENGSVEVAQVVKPGTGLQIGSLDGVPPAHAERVALRDTADRVRDDSSMLAESVPPDVF